MIEDALRIDDPTPQDALATMIVVVADQPGLGVQDQARCGALDVTDVGGRALPRRPVVGGDELELRGTDFRAGDGENPAIAEINGGGFGGPLRFGQIGLDGGLCPRRAVVAAGHDAPGVRRLVPIVSGEPQGHEPDRRHGEDVGDLHGAHVELRRRHEREAHTIRGAVEVVMPLAFPDATHPEQHRPGGIQPLPDRDLAVFRCIGDHGFRCPRFAAVRGGARINGAIIVRDGVPFAAAIHADQLVADGLNHRPRIVAADVLHDVRFRGSGDGCDLHHGKSGGAGEGVRRIARLALDAHPQRRIGHHLIIRLQQNGPRVERRGGERGAHRIAQLVAARERRILHHLREMYPINIREVRTRRRVRRGHDNLDLHGGAIARQATDESGDRLPHSAARQRPHRDMHGAARHEHERWFSRRNRQLVCGQADGRIARAEAGEGEGKQCKEKNGGGAHGSFRLGQP